MLRKVKYLLRLSAGIPKNLPAKSSDYDQELDTRGWNCPVPVLRVRKALNDLGDGQVLHVITTDPGSLVNLRALANLPGITLVDSSETGDEFHFVLKKLESDDTSPSG